MPLTKQQFEQAGLRLVSWGGGTQITGGAGGASRSGLVAQNTVFA